MGIINYLKKRKKILFVAILFFLIQLPFLDQLSLLRGERDIVLTGWSLARTGHDLYGRFLPLEFTGIDPNVPFVPMYATAIWWLLVPFKSVFTARLFFVLVSMSIPFLVFEIVNKVRRDEKIAFITSILFCFSPGIFYLTRLALEIGIAFPLLLAGILAYLNKKKVVSFVFLFLSFFSYHGFRPLIPFLLIYLEIFHVMKGEKKNIFKNILLICSFSVVLLASSLKIDGNLMKSRSSDLIFFNFTQIANQIDYRRNTSTAPKIVTGLFDNKITDLAMFVKDNFFGGVGFEYLFRNGDPASIYATTFSGQFFLIFLVLFVLGFIQLGKKGNRFDVYMLGFILVGLIPSLSNVSYPSYAIRAILSSVGYAYLFGLGFIYLVEICKNCKKNVRQILVSILGVLFLIELSFFGYNFYFRRYITMSEMYFETERSLPLYLSSTDKPYTVYVSSPRDMFYGYAFFNNRIDTTKIQDTMKIGEPYTYGNLTFKKCEKNMQKNKVIISYVCLNESSYNKLRSSSAKRIDYTNYSFRTAFFIID